MRRGIATVVAIAAAASLAGAARAAHAQEALDFVSDRETAAQLARIVESVRSRGLPVEPVVSKARRGALVHAAPARIVSAAQAVATRLETAREALGPRATDVDLAAGEDALSVHGVTREMLEVIHTAQPARSAAVPLGVMAQLVASGVPPQQATEIVARLTRGGASNAQLVSLGNDVNQDVGAGAGAMASLQTRLETLKPMLARGAPVPVPGAAVLTSPRGRP